MRAVLRDAKIAAARAESRPLKRTTLEQRRRARWNAKHLGWRRAEVAPNPRREFRRSLEALSVSKTGKRYGGRRFVRLRKAIQRQEREKQRLQSQAVD